MARKRRETRKRVGNGGNDAVKVLILSHYFPPHHGGIENVAYNQAKYLNEQGHSVTIVTSAIPKGYHDVSDSFTIIRVPAWNIFEDRFGVPYPLFSPQLYRILKKEIIKADVVHAHGHVYMPSVLAAHIASHYNKPFILTQHNTLIVYKSIVLRRMQYMADKLLGKSTLSRASMVITDSEAGKNYVQSILSVKTLIHYNGVDIERFRPTLNQAALRKDLKLPENKIICFTIRRITFKNGVDTMVETAKLLKNHPEILFVIGGKGPELELTRELIKKEKLKNVRLLGMVSEEDLPRYYAAADIFILPSKNGEGFPLVVLEALASGLPVIATRSGGHVEIIESSRHGFVVDPDKPEQIAHYVELLVAQPAQLALLKSYSRQFAEKNLSWKKNVTSLMNVLEKASA
jgi:D-inositol-3-phosphate glycosyltransferase